LKKDDVVVITTGTCHGWIGLIHVKCSEGYIIEILDNGFVIATDAQFEKIGTL